MDSFLALAEQLQLKGLEGNSAESAPEHSAEILNYTEKRTNVRKKQNMSERRISDVKFENEANLFQGRAIMTYQQKPKLMSLIEPAAMEKIESMIEKRVDGNYCKDCGYTSNRTSNMKEHVEKHIEGLEYPCNSCNKIMRTSKALRAHKGTMFH